MKDTARYLYELTKNSVDAGIRFNKINIWKCNVIQYLVCCYRLGWMKTKLDMGYSYETVAALMNWKGMTNQTADGRIVEVMHKGLWA